MNFIFSDSGPIRGPAETNSLTDKIRYFLPSFIIFIVSYRIGFYHHVKNTLNQPLLVLLILISINALLIIISAFFGFDVRNDELNIIDRSVGLYSNPNIAGQICCIGQALSAYFILSKSSKKNIYYIITYFLSLVAAFATFSKAAIIISFLLIINILFSVKNESGKTFTYYSAFKITIISGMVLVFLNLGSIFKNFSFEQLYRFQILESFLTGEFTAETTSLRSLLYKEAISQISSNWLFGYGIGSFDNYYWGAGTHNEYLQIWGNYGIIGLSFYIMYLFRWFLSTLNLNNSTEKSYKNLSFSLLLITSLASMVSHTIVSSKQFSLLIGLIFSKFNSSK